MNDQIIRQLKRLSAIMPDRNFAAVSRRTILALKINEPVFAWPNLRFVSALVSFVAVVAVSVVLFSGNNASTALASPEVLNQEFNNLNINIELKEVDYRQNTNQTIASALSEISDNKVRHLNQDVLRSESGNLDLNSDGTNPQIDQLLDKVIF